MRKHLTETELHELAAFLRCDACRVSCQDYLTRYLQEELTYWKTDKATKEYLSMYAEDYKDMQLIDGEVYELRRVS